MTAPGALSERELEAIEGIKQSDGKLQEWLDEMVKGVMGTKILQSDKVDPKTWLRNYKP